MKLHRAVENAFIETVKRRNLLPKGSCVLAAVSGGSDSVALLRLLHRFDNHMNWKLSVLHIDHHARPLSGEDAAFVKSIADEIGLQCTIRELAEPGSRSLEGYFSAQRSGIYKEYALNDILVTTGHTASDRAETLLMRLLEGAGLRGLGGMDYFGQDSVRRPLLDFTRSELREYLEDIGQKWIEDPTNQENSFLRNRIRHAVIPVLETISQGSILAIARSAANLSQWRDIADSVIEDSLYEILKEDVISRESYQALPRAVRLGVLWTVSGKPRSGKIEFEKTDRWINENKNGNHILPGGTGIAAEGDRLRIRKASKRSGKEEN